jgi:hypothetical protein
VGCTICNCVDCNWRWLLLMYISNIRKYVIVLATWWNGLMCSRYRVVCTLLLSAILWSLCNNCRLVIYTVFNCMLCGFHVWSPLGTYVYFYMWLYLLSIYVYISKLLFQTVIVIKSIIFWCVTLCSMTFHRHFGGMLVKLYQTAQQHIPENSTVHSIAVITLIQAV